MNDEKFELTISDLAGSGTYYADIADELRTRDTAQREALARVEAEHADDVKRYRQLLNEAGRDRYAAQKQLAEAVGLLEQLISTGCWDVSNSAPVDRARDIYMAHRDSKLSKVKGDQAEQQEAQGAQAVDFQREDRYIVIKRKDLVALHRDAYGPTQVAIEAFYAGLRMIEVQLPRRDYLVIEGDWPEYEPTWAAIQARVEGRAALATQPAEQRAREMGYRSASNALDDLDRYKMAMSPPSAAPGITQQQLKDLHNFFGSVCEGGLHSVEKAGIQSLTELGALENCGFGKHRLTRFGTYLLDQPAVRGAEHDQ